MAEFARELGEFRELIIFPTRENQYSPKVRLFFRIFNSYYSRNSRAN